VYAAFTASGLAGGRSRLCLLASQPVSSSVRFFSVVSFCANLYWRKSHPRTCEPCRAGFPGAGVPLAAPWSRRNIPPVEPESACNLDEVLQKAGQRIREFVKNVERFTATESLVHETINKSGGVSGTEKRRYNYMVTMEEIRPDFSTWKNIGAAVRVLRRLREGS